MKRMTIVASLELIVVVGSILALGTAWKGRVNILQKICSGV
ncbi:MAG: hypothetical protein ACFFED_12315 [Candidatus Thorarchaeota archaeon]